MPPPVMTATMPFTLNRLLAASVDMEFPEVILPVDLGDEFDCSYVFRSVVLVSN